MIFIALRAPFFLSSKLVFEKNAAERPSFVRAQTYSTHHYGTNKGRFSIRGFTAVLNLQLEHSCIIVACMLTITTRRARAARAAMYR